MTIRDLTSVSRAAGGGAPRASAAASRPAMDRVELSSQETQMSTRLEALLIATKREADSLTEKLPPHVPGEVLVKLKPGTAGDESFLEEYSTRLVERIDVPPSYGGELLRVRMPQGVSTAQGIAVLSKDQRVSYACSNDLLQAFDEGGTLVPNDLDPRLWGLNNTGQDGGTADADIDAPEAWNISTGKRDGGPLICVIDTGVNYLHNDLKNNIWTNPGEIPGDGIDNDGNGVVDDVHGYNAITGTGDPMDDHSHGSHVSGTIAAEGNNGLGVVGVNWQARIMGAKFLSAGGSGSTADAIKAVLYATRMGARITSNSWGGGAYNQALYDALKASPALHIFAAGNSSNDNDRRASYPATYDLDNIVSVAATDKNDRLAGFSNYGRTTVDLAAPGVGILSTVLGQDYKSYSGTSMATPHVAGVAGLIASVYPNATNAEIKARLLSGVDKLAVLDGKVVSGGRLNAFNSLENDTTAPAAPNDLQAIRVGARGVTLSWTATGDDGWCGRASGYQVRVADKPIVDGSAGQDQVSFDQARVVPAGNPNGAGTVEQANVALIPSSTERTLYFALKVTDNVGNASEMRTGQATIPAAQVAFEDRMEGDESNWSKDGNWARIDVPGRGKVWTDSPETHYGNDQSTSLTSRTISLAGLRGATLLFDARHELEPGFDFVHVEVTRDGQNWTPVGRLTGSAEWNTQQLDLSAYDGQNVQVRFRLAADGSINADGVYIDNVVIAGDPAGN
ncbi:MAG: S8 family serine peptidase [Candidatus Eremiobacterota bacterium]